MNRKGKVDLPPVVTGAAFGTAVGLLMSVIMSAFLAWLVASERLQQENIGYGVMLILLVSSAAGSFAGVMKAKEKRLITAAMTGAGLYILMVVMNIMFFEGRFSGMGETALVVIAGCGLVILAGLKAEKPGKMRVRKSKFR